MKNYYYQNLLISKKQLKNLLRWCFTKYNATNASNLADELKFLGFQYATKSGISINLEDLKIPFVKNSMLTLAYQEIKNSEKIYLTGKKTEVDQFQKILSIWSIISQSLKEEIIAYFQNYDPLNSVYIMAFSGARGNLTQVRQLVGMRGLMSDPSGELISLPIKKNFREGLSITDYLMSGYGARKGIIDTALKTANSGYLTRRLIDVAQDIIIREKDCLTSHSYSIKPNLIQHQYSNIIGRNINKTILDFKTKRIIANVNTELSLPLINKVKKKKIKFIYTRSPLTCKLYRSICQMCYGKELSQNTIIELGEAIGIIAGQSIGEPGTQLTMRTFHTGGIFTSKINEKITSPMSGLVKFSKVLKTISIRTKEGEDVFLTKNSGYLIIIPAFYFLKIRKILIARNTILYIRNNQYIKKNSIIAELIDNKKQIKNKIKPIIANLSGQIYIPVTTGKGNQKKKNFFVWLLNGEVFQIPNSVFLNFYSDHKILKNNHLFRTKLVSHSAGIINFLNQKNNLFQRLLQISFNNKNFLVNAYIYNLNDKIKNKKYLLYLNSKKYLINLTQKNKTFLTKIQINNYFGTFITNKFKTLTGGRIFYDYRLKKYGNSSNRKIFYYRPYGALNELKYLKNAWKLIEFSKKINCFLNKKLKNLIIQIIIIYDIILSISKIKKLLYKSILWLTEESYKFQKNSNFILVKNGSIISRDFEIILGTFSKTDGIFFLKTAKHSTKEITIRSGNVFSGKKFQNFNGKIFYPGEIILKQIKISQLCLCEFITEKIIQQLLIRPLEIFEVPKHKIKKKILEENSNINLINAIYYLYKINQKIKTSKNLELVSNTLQFNLKKYSKTYQEIQFIKKKKKNFLNIRSLEYLSLSQFIPAHLRYTNIKSCILLQGYQFIDQYTTFGYLEDLTKISRDIIKFKSNFRKQKQICLISNENCLKIPKLNLSNKLKDKLIINTISNIDSGKILIENNKFAILQKGQQYLFPNCKNLSTKTNKQIKLKYKTISSKSFKNELIIKKKISLNFYDITKSIITKKTKIIDKLGTFSKILLKKNNELFSSVAIGTIKLFQLKQSFLKSKTSNIIRKPFFQFKIINNHKKLKKYLSGNISFFLKNGKISIESFHEHRNLNLTIVKFITPKLYENLNIHSITDDFFEREKNSIFCQNGDFIEKGQTLGILNFEKEITGDIVQGLPKIEFLLEARKKKQLNKHLPIIEKKDLIIQTTTINSYFEFKKIGTPIKENDNINPHKLLKCYFNYYRIPKHFFCDKNFEINTYQLTENYEASYKTFKKVQFFILNSVQSVYKSQGVSIADKHLEIIIKQMTTKVLITYQGNTSLLPREVIDLYHIKYINKIINYNKKQPALYVPLLLGITKAALNNPSFISAASFQETTRVLTKAAIEGKFDWLRGLKENIITGHLIPAGTGVKNYTNCFNVKTKNKI